MDVPAGRMTVLETIEVEQGLNELHVEVQWADGDLGHRFFHVRHDPVPPCVSEAIEAVILKALSLGKQRMTGHVTLPAGEVALEVWSSVDTWVTEWTLTACTVLNS